MILAIAAFTMPSLARGDYAAEVLSDNPLLYYRFEDSAATNSGTLGASHDGFFDRNVGFVPGPLTGDASNLSVDLSFDKASILVNDLVTVQQFGGAGATTYSSYTVEMWYRTLTNFTASDSLVAGTTIDGNLHGIYTQLERAAAPAVGHTLRFLHRMPPGSAAGDEIRPSDAIGNRFQWHHVAFVNDSGTMSLFHDGVLDGQLAFAPDPFDFDMLFAFGRLGPTLDDRHHPGMLDEIAVYNTALSSARVQAHFAQAPVQSPIIPAGTPEPAFGVDYGQTDQAVQASFLAETLEGNTGPQSITTTGSNPFGSGDLSVTVSEPEGIGVLGLESRNRNLYSSATIEELINDLVATRDGRMTVTISGLPTGEFEWTSWHHDPGGFASSLNSYEAVVDGSSLATFVPSVAPGFVTDDAVATANFTIQATEGEDVVIEFMTLNDFDPNATGFFPMNGFAIDGAVAGFPADFDKDGDVDGEDFLIWQAGFGTMSGATSNTGDANGDGAVDGEDFLLWQSDFGSVAGQGAAAVPESSALVLLSLAVLGCGRCRV